MRFPGMKIPWKSTVSAIPYVLPLFIISISVLSCVAVAKAQDADNSTQAAATPPEASTCNGIYVVYTFTSREKEYPMVKNASAQAWAFKSQLYVLNSGADDLKSWMVHVGFQYNEMLVAIDGANSMDMDLPGRVGKNGTVLFGYPQQDLLTAIETASDYNQMQATVDIRGTQFGLMKGTPMPKTIKLVNEGYKCPAPVQHRTSMNICCKKDPKFKSKPIKSKFSPRRHGDLSLTYDVIKVFEGNYEAQVTIENLHPLGRLDHWNLTWEWMRGEFISSMRGSYTRVKDSSECIFGPQGIYYHDLDFAQIMNCQRNPVISDLPKQMADDDKLGKLPFCCRNGTILPPTMNVTQSKSVFQLTVFKMPPDMNRKTINPPQKWKITGVLNPDYKCSPPIRVDPTQFPDTTTQAISTAVATWQVTCNITRPKKKQSKCCVSFSSYYSESVIPCNTCACGCNNQPRTCDANANALELPPDALLVPFDNRTLKAKAWASLKHHSLPKILPCPDNCGVSINWHVDTDYSTGWTARMTLFNWRQDPFQDWFAAIEMDKAFVGYENVYSFNGTRLSKPKNTIFFQGREGLTYLMGETNGSRPDSPRVPGKQQSVISFLKKNNYGIKVSHGDGFPTRVFFNGEECALPKEFPKRNGSLRKLTGFNFVLSMLSVGIMTMFFVL
ncbi:COBRA-like protein 10 [Impatiens glandulifera]|uniref:COBRA-like protein 10 n=1 Tax=Impatiens glandulifera TaxID=253017 RepID=UPI001FB18792|nr:COBRA-like protein 10 [Impatiens glandulifera]